jgi:hypothetical protein
MRRVVYCPSENLLDEAVALSKDTHLQINIGGSEELDLLDFNRKKVQIVLIPELNNINYLKNVKKSFHQIVTINNDFISFTKNINVLFENKIIKPNILEKHYVRFFFPCNNIGELEAVLYDKIELEKIRFNVY